jgi:hypothetical protein
MCLVPRGGPIDIITQVLRAIDGTSRGLPDQSRIPPDRDELTDVTPMRTAPEPQAPAEAPPPHVQAPLEAAPRMKTLLSKPTNFPSA